MLQNQEFLKEFAEEALVHIENVENNLLDIEKEEVNRDIIDEMLRSTHSIKGTAGFFELNKIVELSHAMESLFGELRDGTILINHKMIDVLLDANDCLKDMIMHADSSECVDISMHIEKLLSAAKDGAPEEKTAEGANHDLIMKQTEELTVKNELIDSELTIDNPEKAVIEDALRHGHKLYRASVLINEGFNSKGINIIALFKKVQSIGNIIESCCGFTGTGREKGTESQEACFTFLFTSVLEKGLAALALNIPKSYINELGTSTEELDKVYTQQQVIEDNNNESSAGVSGTQTEIPKREEAKRDEQITIEDSIRVHTSLLDDLLNLAGEMILSKNRLYQTVKSYKRDIHGLDLILKNTDHVTKELQEKIMQTRMQPVANVFNRFPRIVRELSRKLDKEVELEMEGMEVGLDKSIIESLIDPLTHIIRNAVGHGIESPEIRINAGKSRMGKIIMKARHEGGYVKIDIIDDGRGIDVGRIREKAKKKEMVEKSEFLFMEDDDIIRLLFMPGFSMAEEVTDISGRGVGLDVVKTNIEKLGGSVEVDTVRGKGTTFRLTLPLTVSIIPSLIVEVQGEKYAVPQVNLQEIVRIKPEDRHKKIEHINNVKLLRLRDELLPAVYLSDILGVQGKDVGKNTDIIRVLIVKVRSGRFGLIVDTVNDNEEILIKSLPIYMENCEFYLGVTVLGDGRISMIIDPEGIASKVNLKYMEGLHKVDEKKTGKIHQEEGQQELILFKCSGPETFGIDFSMISRVVEIDVLKIEKVGDKEYINYLGNPLRIIRPEDYLPVRRGENNCKKAYVIIPKNFGQPVGILIEKVYDSIKTLVKLDEEAIKAKGLLGSSIINNKIVLLINMHELFDAADLKYYGLKEFKELELGTGQGSDFS